VLTAIAIDRSRPERAFLGGGGASSRRERALEQALFELGQSRTAFKVYRPSLVKNIQVDSRVADMTDFFDAALFYGYAPNLGRLNWYRETQHVRDWSSVATLETRDTQREYDEMLGWLRGAGWTPVILEFGDTWPDLHLVKVLVPQLTQASVPSHPYLGHPRFYDLPHRLGLTETRLHYEDLNTDPVPFP
jgi:ribosomal protein S12 methylthiotransferase accessory factor